MDLLQLPKRYDLVVGDSFELFYKGIVKCLCEDAIDFELRYSDGVSRGNNYAEKYVFTPEAKDVGTHTLSIRLRSNFGEVLDEGSVQIHVVPRPTSPQREKVVLLIGDSLTAPGIWPSELDRRLTGTGGTPVGDALTGITFIGSREHGGTKYEGYGGWTFDSYTTANAARNYCMYINGSFDAGALTQHSVYRDANGQLWKLETVTATRIKLIAVQNVEGTLDVSCTALPESGTLCYEGGGASAARIEYTSSEYAEGNPFWNAAEGRNSFTAYAAAQGVSTIDEIVILLGWNNTFMEGTRLAERALVLIDGILAELPDCHITLVGLQVPSRDGFGENYGISWNYFEKMSKVFEFQNAFIALTEREEYAGSLSFVSLAGQFDTVHDHPERTVAVNNRNDATEVRGSNGVHPSASGYLQIADAVYRHLAARLAAEN